MKTERSQNHNSKRRHLDLSMRRTSSLLALALLLLAALAACGTSGKALQPSATATTEPGSQGSAAPVASPAPLTPTAAPLSPSVAPSALASSVPSAPPVASAAPSPVASAAPSASPTAVAPSSSPSAIPSPFVSTNGWCPEAYTIGAYTGPEGQKWYRNPAVVAIFYRQPLTVCFASEAAAQAAGYTLDPRPARVTTSSDGTCPQENLIRGFTDTHGQRVYLLPGEPGYATQKATNCFSDTGLAAYYGFSVATLAPAPGQAVTVIPTGNLACPDAYPWGAYIGPEGQLWYRRPESVAVYYRQPASLCFVTEAAAQSAGYAPDPRPARETKSPDGTCPKDNPVKGFTNALGQQVYLAPGEPNFAAQQATHCFSDTGIAEYYGFTPALTTSAPGASATPMPVPSPLPSGGALTLGPQVVDLGTVSTGTGPATRTISLAYTGPGNITIKAIKPQVTGPDASEFTVKLEQCAVGGLANGGTCTFTVTFQPKGGPGERNATLTILINDTITSTPATLKGTAK